MSLISILSAKRSSRTKLNQACAMTASVVVLAAGLVAILAAPASAQDKKPNIVMLMTDDTGWGDFGAYGIAKMNPACVLEKAARDGFFAAMRLLGIDMSAGITRDPLPWTG